MRAITYYAIRICLILWMSLRGLSWIGHRPFIHRSMRSWAMCSEEYPVNQVPRSEIPSRYDSCRMLLTGVVGTDPREVYMKNGHYVINFALAVVGHFKAIHEMETYKPTETMWLSAEVWDSVAKAAYANIKKGAVVRGVGYLIHNKWVDKNTGEERKMFKVRITKMLNYETFNDISVAFEGTEDLRTSSHGNAGGDSGFASESPDVADQSESTYSYRKQPSTAKLANDNVGRTRQGQNRPASQQVTYEGCGVSTDEPSVPWWG